MFVLLKKAKTLLTVDKRWLVRYLWKYGKQKTAFFAAKFFRRNYWDVTEDGVTIKLSFFTPYHQSIAKSQHNRDYEKPVMQAWMREIDGKKIIYDVGGFNGLYGLLAAKKNPGAHVTIFEPDRVNAAHVRANILTNELKNCTIQEAAVSDYTGTTTFSQGGTSGEHIIDAGETVKVIALRDLPHADLLKIDVEGAELKALKGMGYASTILLEVHPLFVSRFNTSEEEISEFLSETGYQVEFLYERDKAKHYLLHP